jgi:cysteinyl-tRNA synthetase
MKLFNTFSRKKEKFVPLENKLVKMYTCGPTVYDYAHIGNFRSYLAADFLRRTLEYLGYTVQQVKNITDVGHLTQDDIDEGEDKIQKAAQKGHKTPQAIARFYEKAFREDEAKLNIKKAAVYPRATENVPDMIRAVQKLLQKGFAYQSEGAVFFDVKKFKDYGKLSGNTLDKLDTGHRVKCERFKKNPYDFYLWRPADKDHLMKWLSPWGEGYPGWHIECSVMSRKYLETDTLDIHSGGEDNIFPHHENEIAQSEALTGQKFVNYWFHSGYLLVEGEKMAKSKGNFYTLRDLEKKGYDPLAFRMLAFTSHYRSPMDFSFKALHQASENMRTIKNFIWRLQEKNISSTEVTQKPSFENEELIKIKENFQKAFQRALGDDLNTPQAFSLLMDFIKTINTYLDNEQISQQFVQDILNLMKKLDDMIFACHLSQQEIIPKEIQEMAQKRQLLKKTGDYDKADNLREEIEKRGYKIHDNGKQYFIRKNI